MAIATYYAKKRAITNKLAVSCADSALNADNETVALNDYLSQIQTPISAYLASHPGINFIVLTKGIPIRIDGAATGSEGEQATTQDYQPSLDSYLAALGYSTANGNVKAKIAGSGAKGLAWINKYYNSTAPFTHTTYGGYLVTRLDGFTQADATALVDRSLAALQNPLTGPILFDVDINFGLGDKTAEPPLKPSTNVKFEESYDHGNADLLHASDVLRASGITTQSVITNTFVGNQSHLLGYFSWGSNDSDFNNNAYESLAFAPGAISNTFVSTSMDSFIGQYVGFKSINLTGMTSMKARVSDANSAGPSYIFQVRLDSPSGPVIGTCSVPVTGGWQSWATTRCSLTPGVSGIHDVFLTFIPNGYGGDLYNLEWISFQGVPSVIEAASYNQLSRGPALENCSEGGQDLAYIANGSYAVYKSIRLNGMTSFQARVASGGTGGAIQVHLDSPTGTLIGTCPAPVTGGWQTWTTQTCSLAGAGGVHDVYLVFSGGDGYLYNLEWLNFLGGTSLIEVASNQVLSGDASLETCSEGGQDLGNIPDGQSHMGDLIANGLTGAEGYVNEPTLDALVGLTYTISHYEAGYTLAESFYAGTPYLGWEGTVVGDPLCAPYFGAMPPVAPIQASAYQGSSGGVGVEDCSEGNQDVADIRNGSYTSYNKVDLTGANTFRARVASAGSGGSIQIHLDRPTGALIGTCVVPVTGDWQKWTTVTCGLSGASGIHQVYLVYTGGGGSLFNVEWFAFAPSVEASSYRSVSTGTMQLETCAEGGLDLTGIANENYAVYSGVDLTGKTHFAARMANTGAAGTLRVRLDSPTGTVIGTCAVPATGDGQTWATKTCGLSGASGTHNLYLGFTGASGASFNLEWFAFN